MMTYQSNRILEIKQEIDSIKEYVESDLCKKCEEMTTRLKYYESLLHEYSGQNVDNSKSDS